MSQETKNNSLLDDFETLTRSIEGRWSSETESTLISLENRLRQLEELGFQSGPSLLGKAREL
ncbi:MAG: hypothetical protein PHC51_04395 [bacterium]|nr:hypothetical protein [bacterium]